MIALTHNNVNDYKYKNNEKMINIFYGQDKNSCHSPIDSSDNRKTRQLSCTTKANVNT